MPLVFSRTRILAGGLAMLAAAQLPSQGADFDGNGKADLLWRNGATGQVYVMPMNGASVLPGAMVWNEPNPAWQIVGTGDFDGDGKTDLLWRNTGTGQVFQILMNGTAVKGSGMIYSEPDLAWSIQAVADFDGDGKADILWRNANTGAVYVMPMNGAQVLPGAVVWTEADPAWQIVGTGDFDGDGKADILWRNTVTGQVFQILMNGTQVKASGLIYTEPNSAWAIKAVADFTGDGKADILWRNASSGQVYLMPMNGAQVLPGAVVWTAADPAWQIAAVGDFDGDRKADVMWWNASTGQIFQLLMDGTTVKASGMVYAEPNTAWTINGGINDRATGGFSLTGSMLSARLGHSATLLANGKVLIAGGYDGKQRVASAELYDPASGTFSATGSMNYATEEHSATRLADGSVLIIGGRNNANQATDRVERYDPATGTFTLQNSLNHGRLEYHSATLLPDGRVLVAGGAAQAGGSSDSSVAVAELYSPNAGNGPNPARLGKAVDSGLMHVARYGHLAMINPSNSNYVLVLGGSVGGEGGDSPLEEEAYNVATGQFEVIQPTPTTKRGGSALVYLGGMRWLSAGGYDHDSGRVLASSDLIDGNANGGLGAILPGPALPLPVCLPSSQVLADGRVLITGGFSDIGSMTSVNAGLVYDPAGNGGLGAFSPVIGGMHSPRRSHTVTLLGNGKVLVAGGGTTGDSSAMASAELFN